MIARPWLSRDVFRAYVVVLDGERAGEIRRGQHLELPVTGGCHKVSMKIDWCRSQEVEVEAQTGEIVQLLCQPAGSALFALFAITFGWKSYISLNRDAPHDYLQ